MNRNVQEDLKQLDSILKQHGLSRRDALKIMGLGGAGVMVGGTTEASAATTLKASDAKGKILIIGGGLSGVATAAKLSNSLSNPDITIIEPNPKSVSYQPGNTLIGAGIWTKDDVTYETKDFYQAVLNGFKTKLLNLTQLQMKLKLQKVKLLNTIS